MTSPARVEEGTQAEVLPPAWGAHPNLKRELCHGPVVPPQETRNPHHVTLSANCSLLFCISLSSCFQRVLETKPCPISSLSTGSLVNKRLLMEMQQATSGPL